MSDSRKHRGPHPADENLFAEENLDTLRRATADFCWLLDHGYPVTSSLKLVGDRFCLQERQRTAVKRVSCSSAACEIRTAKRVAISNAPTVWIDGFNLLTTIEAALAGGFILKGRDGCYRDMASMHGTYRKVDETRPALLLVGEYLKSQSVAAVHWLLDQPVSNSGRLATVIREIGESHDWNWTVELVRDPDPVLKELKDAVVVSADSEILNQCASWANVAKSVVDRVPDIRVLDFYPGGRIGRTDGKS
ncbi:MAG: DUF434 domain-containing protein [Planctomycetaceae bacterium]